MTKGHSMSLIMQMVLSLFLEKMSDVTMLGENTTTVNSTICPKITHRTCGNAIFTGG